MTNTFGLSQREQEVVKLLLEGKSNKQMALELGISDSTIEFHLTRIYARLGVGSRAEAIIVLGKLGKTLVNSTSMEIREDRNRIKEDFGKSIVEEMPFSMENESEQILPFKKKLATFDRIKSFFMKYRIPVALEILLVLALLFVLIFFIFVPRSWRGYDRECENPDEYSVGQTMRRSNASSSNVHGQYGTIAGDPWSAQSGYVLYTGIRTPQLDDLYISFRYSKNSPASVPILIYLDNESTPRATFYPTDLADWNTFEWSEPVLLGSFNSGLHSILFYTQGQSYGVADLDRFVLNSNSP